MDVSAFNQFFEGLGFKLGDGFRRIQQVWKGHNEGLSRLTLKADVPDRDPVRGRFGALRPLDSHQVVGVRSRLLPVGGNCLPILNMGVVTEINRAIHHK